MTTEDKLKQCIIENYGTVNDFCSCIGMPTSTMFTILKRGVLCSSTTTMLKICSTLGIDLKALTLGEILYVSQEKDEPFELLQCIKQLEEAQSTFTYKQKVLSKEERLKIAFTLKLALEQL